MTPKSLLAWFALPKCLTKGIIHNAIYIDTPCGPVLAVGKSKAKKQSYGHRLGRGARR
jgi:hypothetical protein